MSNVGLPILTLNLPVQRYSCHGCGNCCRDFTVQLRDEDLRLLAVQGWETRLGEPITVEFRGVRYLRQRPDGSCIFLESDGKCRVHAEFGFENKPIACQLFPFHLSPSASGPRMGVNFACQSVLESKGAALGSHRDELARMGARIPETLQQFAPPLLGRRLRATTDEERSLIKALIDWLGRRDLPWRIRFDGLAWLSQSLAGARFETVRGDRFDELLEILTVALPGELPLHPVDPPSAGQRRLFRQAVFSRTEDVKIGDAAKLGRWRITFSQLRRSRIFSRGSGPVPQIGPGWSNKVTFEQVNAVGIADDPSIDELMSRYLRASILGGRCWGSGYYGWSMTSGLAAHVLGAAVVGWLARFSAAGRGAAEGTIEDVRRALGRVDRSSGRAKWLGSAGERLRLGYLVRNDGLRRTLAEAWRWDHPDDGNQGDLAGR